MKHDIFEFSMTTMTRGERAWRVLFLLAIIAVVAYDLLVGRPG
jgi:hypothetical protein